MNSRQRRWDRRVWKYSTETLCRDWDVYNEMWQWLVARHGKKIYKCGWREKDTYWVSPGSDRMHVIWEFRREKDLTAFILRWS